MVPAIRNSKTIEKPKANASRVGALVRLFPSYAGGSSFSDIGTLILRRPIQANVLAPQAIVNPYPYSLQGV